MSTTRLERRVVSVLAGAAAIILSAASAQAAMTPAPKAHYADPGVQKAWCGLGFHLGPLGACLAGGPGPRYYGGPPYPGRACPPGYHLGPYGRRCWPN